MASGRWVGGDLVVVVSMNTFSAGKVLFNRSGEKERIARMAGLVPVMQQWHKKKVTFTLHFYFISLIHPTFNMILGLFIFGNFV